MPAILLPLVAGLALSLQVGINSTLARHVGSFEAAAFSALVTAVVLNVVVLVSTRGWGVAQTFRLPVWLWLGGLSGVLGLSAIVYAPSRIGAFATIGLLIAGQLGGAVVVDTFGWVGVQQRSLTAGRATGLVMLVAGAVLVLRR